MKYYVYVIKSRSTGKFYTGMTNDLQRRISEHNRSKSNTIVTKYLTDFELVYSEEVDSREIARKREKYLKSGCGRKFRDQHLSSINKRW